MQLGPAGRPSDCWLLQPFVSHWRAQNRTNLNLEFHCKPSKQTNKPHQLSLKPSSGLRSGNSRRILMDEVETAAQGGKGLAWEDVMADSGWTGITRKSFQTLVLPRAINLYLTLIYYVDGIYMNIKNTWKEITDTLRSKTLVSKWQSTKSTSNFD